MSWWIPSCPVLWWNRMCTMGVVQKVCKNITNASMHLIWILPSLFRNFRNWSLSTWRRISLRIFSCPMSGHWSSTLLLASTGTPRASSSSAWTPAECPRGLADVSVYWCEVWVCIVLEVPLTLWDDWVCAWQGMWTWGRGFGPCCLSSLLMSGYCASTVKPNCTRTCARLTAAGGR